MMAAPRVKTKWRPPLALIVYAVLLAMMSLPVLIIIWFRAADMSVIRMSFSEAGALVVVLVLALAVAYVFVRTITRPIHALIARTGEIAHGGRTAIRPLESYGTREIAILSQSFLDLAGKLVDRTEYVRSFAAHVSHELKSPLTAIRGAAELLHEDAVDQPMTTAQRLRFLDNIIADAKRLDMLLVRLRELAQAELSLAEGNSCLDDIVPMLRSRFPAIHITAGGRTSASLSLPMEAAGIVFINLSENSLQHGATRLDLTVTASDQNLMIVVKDNGSGIPDANRERVFQPFFSTRREQGGTGMGLDIVRAMLYTHGGTIDLGNCSGGAEFRLIIPESAPT